MKVEGPTVYLLRKRQTFHTRSNSSSAPTPGLLPSVSPRQSTKHGPSVITVRNLSAKEGSQNRESLVPDTHRITDDRSGQHTYSQMTWMAQPLHLASPFHWGHWQGLLAGGQKGPASPDTAHPGSCLILKGASAPTQSQASSPCPAHSRSQPVPSLLTWVSPSSSPPPQEAWAEVQPHCHLLHTADSRARAGDGDSIQHQIYMLNKRRDLLR